jgi:hypothetical protein
MNSETDKCKKCGKFILKSNLILHESMCHGKSYYINEIQDDDDILHANKKVNNTTPELEDIFHCTICDNYLDISEKNDHLLCHQYEHNYNDEQQINGQINRNDNTNIRNGNRSSSNSSNI